MQITPQELKALVLSHVARLREMADEHDVSETEADAFGAMESAAYHKGVAGALRETAASLEAAAKELEEFQV